MATDQRKSTRHSIPHHIESNCALVGVLEQQSPETSTQGRKIALILHGTLGHKDYLFLKRLAHRLPIDSFRFDFRGNHESGGVWKQGALDEDLEDIATVVDYLKRNFGYEVDLLVGHSRGAIVGFRWLCISEDGRRCGAFVNASARYRMGRLATGNPAYKAAFDSVGYHDRQVTVARKTFTARVYPKDIESFINWDTSLVWERFPLATDVLTIHGLADQVVPPYDAVIYHCALSGRSPGTHNLHLVEDADHNFTGRQDEVVDTILAWWGQRQSGSLTTGLWLTGVRGKL
ncbi:hypothetical protein PLICRDRAFT_158204 [Plicaturopsis crispa FD-325 SS-3]|nr:hypothetical protein PLICRDRAFT_158204 [Plicaturopsis crispa FD-325 SS-3]